MKTNEEQVKWRRTRNKKYKDEEWIRRTKKNIVEEEDDEEYEKEEEKIKKYEKPVKVWIVGNKTNEDEWRQMKNKSNEEELGTRRMKTRNENE